MSVGTKFCIVDACGMEHCVVFQDDTPQRRRDYKRHAAWWRRYVQTEEGRKAYRGKMAYRAPAFPVRVSIGD